MLHRHLRILAALIGIALLAACASAPSVPYDRGAANVKKIIGLGPEMPDRANVFQAATIGQSFGLVGLTIDSAIQNAREKALAEVVQAQRFNAQEGFILALIPAIEGRGYEIAFDLSPRPRHDYYKDYPPPKAPADAYLDIVAEYYGYLLAGPTAKFRPFLWVKCRLVRTSDHAVLMESWVQYNAVNAPENVVTLSPNEKYAFDTVDEMKADPKRAVAGLNDAFTAVSAAIGTLLH